MVVCVSYTRPLIESNLTECLSGGLPILMAGGLNAKRRDWNSRLTTAPALSCQPERMLDLGAAFLYHGSLSSRYNPVPLMFLSAMTSSSQCI
jgi:hypothetical protein